MVDEMDMSRLEADSAPIGATDGEAKTIGTLAARAIALKNEIDAVALYLGDLQKKYFTVTEKDLPEAMDAAACKTFEDAKTGKKITVKDEVRASISKPNQAEAHKWLRDNNHADLIKNEIKVPLDKGKDNIAGEILTLLKKKFDIEAERSESVHASTLSAFCREQLSKGVELPAAPLGLFIRRVAVIK